MPLIKGDTYKFILHEFQKEEIRRKREEKRLLKQELTAVRWCAAYNCGALFPPISKMAAFLRGRVPSKWFVELNFMVTMESYWNQKYAMGR